MSTSPKEPVQNAVLPTNGRAEPLVDVHSPNHRIAVWENVEKLRGYAANWDGYGAPPFTNEMLEAVKTFLTHLPEDLLLYPFMEADCLLPAVVPMSDGAIQLEWHVGSRVLELEFETPSTIHYLKWWPQESIEEEEMYPAEDWGQSTRLIEWVLHGHDPE